MSSDRMADLGLGAGRASIDETPEEDVPRKGKKKGGKKTSSVPLVSVTVEEKSPSSADHGRLFEPIQEGVETIKKQTAMLRSLDVNTVDERGATQLSEKIERAMQTATVTGRKVKGHLDEIKASIQRGQKSGEPGMQARGNLYNASAKDFHGVMNEYNTVYNSVRQRVNDNKKRQLRNLPGEAQLSESQIDAVIDAGKEQEVMQKAMMMEDLSDLQDIVADIEERHAEILKLEKSVLELLELFKDLSILVDVQGEQLDVISGHVARAVENVKGAERKLVSAEKSQISARKKKCFLLLCLVGIVVVALVMGGFFGGVFGKA